MLLLPDGAANDLSMESVWDQTNDQVVFGELGIKRLVVGDIEGDGPCELNTFRELLCGFESSAS